MTSAITIVIVDDHPLLCAGVANILRKRADLHVIEQGANADEAKEIAQRLAPNVMLMDLNMPGDVFEAVRFITTKLSNVRVLILTASESDEDAYSALQAGASGYVLKGVGGHELVQAIRAVAKGESYITPGLGSMLLNNFKKHESAVQKISLTPREEQVIREVSKGLTNKEVAAKLSISDKTVKYYMYCLMQKLHVRNRVEAIAAFKR